MYNFTTDSPEQTINLARQISRYLPKQLVIALSGELGSGKTTFVKGIACGIGISPDKVSSPSYVLIKEYKNKDKNLFHCDLYRLNNAQDIVLLGIEDYYLQEGIFIIEWAEKAAALLPDEYLHIEIKPLSMYKRRFSLSIKGQAYKKLLNNIGKKLNIDEKK